MKNFISNNYQLVATGAYLVKASILTPTTFDIVAITLLASYSAFKAFLVARGKVLDKDEVLATHKADFEILKANLIDTQAELRKQVEELKDLKSKLSLATTRNTQAPAGVKW